MYLPGTPCHTTTPLPLWPASGKNHFGTSQIFPARRKRIRGWHAGSRSPSFQTAWLSKHGFLQICPLYFKNASLLSPRNASATTLQKCSLSLAGTTCTQWPRAFLRPTPAQKYPTDWPVTSFFSSCCQIFASMQWPWRSGSTCFTLQNLAAGAATGAKAWLFRNLCLNFLAAGGLTHLW